MSDPRRETLVMGRNSVEELLKRSPERILHIYTLKQNKENTSRAEELLKQIQQLRIKVLFISKDEMERMVHSDSHQGFVAAVKQREQADWRDIQELPSLILLLDSIEDPHNLGAILRACECFKVSLVIWSRNRGAQLSPVVSKVSSGASEVVPIQIVSNLSDTLLKLKEEDYHIVSAQVADQKESLFDFSFPEKTALILGSEGEGIRPLLQKHTDTSLYIPMYGQIDSLNVSQAAAVMLAFWRSSITP